MRVNLLDLVAVILASTALFSVGCSQVAQKQHVKRVLVNPKASVHTVEYNKGYVAGCASGRNAVGDKDYGFEKDASKYAINSEYSAGWDEGYALCQEEYLEEIQNKVKQEVNLHTDDPNTTEVRHKIWNELKK